MRQLARLRRATSGVVVISSDGPSTPRTLVVASAAPLQRLPLSVPPQWFDGRVVPKKAKAARTYVAGPTRPVLLPFDATGVLRMAPRTRWTRAWHVAASSNRARIASAVTYERGEPTSA